MTLTNYYLLTKGDLYFKMREYDVPMKNELNKYEVDTRLLRHV